MSRHQRMSKLQARKLGSSKIEVSLDVGAWILEFYIKKARTTLAVRAS